MMQDAWCEAFQHRAAIATHIDIPPKSSLTFLPPPVRGVFVLSLLCMERLLGLTTHNTLANHMLAQRYYASNFQP